MNAATYTKIAKSANYNDNTMSLGFRRYLCLPAATKTAVSVAAYLTTNNTDTHDYIVNFFAPMTEAEYRSYIITH